MCSIVFYALAVLNSFLHRLFIDFCSNLFNSLAKNQRAFVKASCYLPNLAHLENHRFSQVKRWFSRNPCFSIARFFFQKMSKIHEILVRKRSRKKTLKIDHKSTKNRQKSSKNRKLLLIFESSVGISFKTLPSFLLNNKILLF